MKDYRTSVTSRLWKHVNVLKHEIRIPGGTSKDGNHAAYGLAYRYNKEIYEIEVLIVPYVSNWQREKEKVKKEEDPLFVYPEAPQGTMVRKLADETGLIALSYYELDRKSIRDNRFVGEEVLHWKYAYAVENYDDSNLRTKVAFQGKSGVPFWVPLALLRLSGNLFEHHKWILDAFDKHLELQRFLREKGLNRSNPTKSLRIVA